VIVDWKVKEGDAVAADTPVCEVETDKATFEVPAGASGTVLKILRAAGDDVPVLEAIAVFGAAGEDWQAAVGGAAAPSSASAPAPEAAPQAAQARSRRPHRRRPFPRRLPQPAPSSPPPGRAAWRRKKPWTYRPWPVRARTGASSSGRGGRHGRPSGLTAAAKAALAAGGSVPAAGSGLAGRATAADIASTGSAASGAAAAPAPVSRAAAAGEGAVTETPIKGIRKLIADRMMDSLATMAQFTLNASASAVRMQELRARMKASPEELGLSKVTINDLILFAVSRVLPKYPFMNAHKTNGVVKTFERVHLGLAVDTPRGLMVPVIRNADLLSLEQISAEAKRLAAACQGGSIKRRSSRGPPSR
jgi:pyruvate dehydrogenase E2 component (dihydrolipoamide acetyltransferase)